MLSYFIDEFKIHLKKEKKVSNNTYENYLRDVKAFLSFKNYLSIPSSEDIVNYKNHLQNLGKSNATILRVNASLRCYYNFLHKKKLIDKIPSTKITIKNEHKIPDILSVEEIERLLNMPDTTNFKGIRDKAILETFYATGMKPTEIISINVSDVNLKLGFIKFNNANKERFIPIHNRAVKAISDYLKHTRNFMVFNNDENLFLNMSGEPLTRQGVWKIIKSYAEKLNLNKQITPHTIRHSFASHLVENGAGIDDIKEILGFSDISSAKIYSDIFKAKYAKAYNHFHPFINKTM